MAKIPTDEEEGRGVSKRELDIRFEYLSDALRKMEDGTNTRFVHTERMFQLSQDSAQRAVDKAESAQAAHNVAANEWRATLNDFKANLINRPEFDRFYAEFSAYRLEQSRQMSITAGAKQEKMENKEDWKSIVAIIISIAAVVIAYITRHG
jgi:hypothetical protein